jgi:eukaryotic translation initiation factor 2C
MEKVKEFPELNVKNFAYDGDKSMFTMGRLTERKMEFIVVVDDVVGSIS